MAKPKPPKPTTARLQPAGIPEIARRYQPAPVKPVTKRKPKGK